MIKVVELIGSNALEFIVEFESEMNLEIIGRVLYNYLPNYGIKDADLIRDSHDNINKLDIFYLIKVAEPADDGKKKFHIDTGFIIHSNNSDSPKCKVQLVWIDESSDVTKTLLLDDKKAKRSISVVVDPERDSGPYEIVEGKSE